MVGKLQITNDYHVTMVHTLYSLVTKCSIFLQYSCRSLDLKPLSLPFNKLVPPFSHRFEFVSAFAARGIVFLFCFSSVISKLDVCPFYLFTSVLKVKGSRPGKNVQLTENEIRGLCLKSREIFLSQPILLELEAPLKICGKI